MPRVSYFIYFGFRLKILLGVKFNLSIAFHFGPLSSILRCVSCTVVIWNVNRYIGK